MLHRVIKYLAGLWRCVCIAVKATLLGRDYKFGLAIGHAFVYGASLRMIFGLIMRDTTMNIYPHYTCKGLAMCIVSPTVC